MKAERFFIIFLVIAAAIVASFFMSPIYAAMLIPALTFGIILLGHPRTFLFVYLSVMSIYPLLRENFQIGPVKYLNELMGAVLFGMFLLHLCYRQLDFSRIKKWTVFAFIFLGYVAFTWLFNRGVIQGAVQCLFSYLSIIPLYILCVNYLKRSDFYVLLWGSLWFFWFNFILNIGWFLRINPLVNYHLSINNMVDVARGTFGACNYVAYFCCMFFFLLISVLSNGALAEKKRLRVWTIITLPAVLVQLYLTYTNHAYMFFAIAFILYAVVSGLWKKWQSWGVLALLIGAIIAAFVFSEEIQTQFTKERLNERYGSLVYSAKVQLLNDLLVKNLQENPLEWVIGVGPGNGMGGIGKANLTPFALRMLLNYYQAFDIRAMQMTSITGTTTSAILTLWGDFGLIGFILYCMLYTRLFKVCFRVAKHDGGNAQEKAIAQFLVGALVLFALVNVVVDVLFHVALTHWLWVWLALLNLSDKPEKPLETVTKVPRAVRRFSDARNRPAGRADSGQ